MGVDYLPQKLDEYVSVEAIWYHHVTYMTVTADAS